MSAITLLCPHTNDSRGNADMDKPKKEFQYGNTTVIIHSPLVNMNPKQQKQWFKEEWKNGNPVLKEIAAAVHNCYRK